MESTTSFLVPVLLLSFLLSSASTTTATPNPPFPKEALPTKSGYLPVNTTSGSAFYFTYYEAQQPTSPLTQTPLLVWLQGGPGCSSLIGNFFELGPWLVTTNSSDAKNNTRPFLKPNPSSWNRIFGLLFIDNPIGTGFSTAPNPDEIPRNQPTVANHLWIGLQHFLSSNPSFRSRPLYLTGESYAGKYIPAAGYHILKMNAGVDKSQRINLVGVAIGDGLTHPVTQVATHASNAYFSGLINERQRVHLEKLQAEAVRLTMEEKWAEATNARNQVLNWLKNVTGLATLYDFTKKRPYATDKVTLFLRDELVREALSAEKGMVWEECSDTAGRILHEDVMKSVKFMVDGLVNHVKVLLYQGQFDLRDGVVSVEAWVKELNWEGLESYLKAERKVWKVRGELAGYVQRWGRLSQVVVAGAGHLLPADQGPNSQAMIEDWVLQNGLFGDEIEEIEPSSFRRSY